MGGSYLYGWDEAGECWRKILINSEGKLIIDPSEIFENDPTDNEHGKAPDSDWAYEHENNASVHHSKNVIIPLPLNTWDANSPPHSMPSNLDVSYVYVTKNWPASGALINLRTHETYPSAGACQIWIPYGLESGYSNVKIRFGDYPNDSWTDWQDLAPDVDSKISDHAAVSAAHHARYTDAEAVKAFTSENKTITTGTHTDIDVTGVTMIYFDVDTGNIILKGMGGGVENQLIKCFLEYNGSNTLTIVDNSADASAGDKIITRSRGNETTLVGRTFLFNMLYKRGQWILDQDISL